MESAGLSPECVTIFKKHLMTPLTNEEAERVLHKYELYRNEGCIVPTIDLKEFLRQRYENDDMPCEYLGDMGGIKHACRTLGFTEEKWLND